MASMHAKIPGDYIYVKPQIHCEPYQLMSIHHMANEKVCRWTNLLYVNNLKWVTENTFGENCLPQTWWVATELFPNITSPAQT